jgi:ACT domain-containing protein
MARHDVIVTLTGESTGIQKAAKSGALAMQGLATAIQSVVEKTQSSSTAVNKYRDGLENYTNATKHAKAAVAQLNQEEAKRIAIENQLIATLTKEEVAVLRKNGIIRQEVAVIQSVTSATMAFTATVGVASASTSTWVASIQRFRGATGGILPVLSEAKAAVAQLTLEKTRAIEIEKMLVNALDAEEVALLRNAGIMTSFTDVTDKSTQAVASGSKAIMNTTSAAGSAQFAVLGLTQGVQDMGNFGMGAAQGIRAVNNNVQQFATALTFASGQAGGLGKAMKGMWTAIKGPAGLLLAFSAISAAIEFFANASQKGNKEAKGLASGIDDIIKAASGFVSIETALTKFNITQGQAAHATIFLSEKIRALTEENTKLSRNAPNATKEDADRFIANRDLIVRLGQSFETLISVSKSYQTEAFAEQVLRDAGLGPIIDEIQARKELAEALDALLKKSAALAVQAKFIGKQIGEGLAIAPTAALPGVGTAIGRAKAIKEGGVVTEDGVLRQDALDQIQNELSQVDNGFGGVLAGIGGGYDAIGLAFMNTTGGMTDEIAELGRSIEEQNRTTGTSFSAWWRLNAETVNQSAQLMGSAIGGIGTSFMTIARQGGEGSKSMFETGKKFAIAQALISTYTAITKALEMGPIIGPILAASIGVQGFAQVAAIRATKMGGSGTGGGVKGGGGGVSAPPNAFSNFTSLSELTSRGAGPSFGGQPQPIQTTQFRFVMRGDELIGVLDNTLSKGSTMVGKGTIGAKASLGLKYNGLLDNIYEGNLGI